MDENQPHSEYDESEDLDDAQSDDLDDVEDDDLDDDELDELDDPESDEAPPAAGPNGDIEELVRYVASRLVQDPDELTVESEFRGGTVYVSLRVPEAEMGRVIGREGRTAKAIRTLVSIAGSRQNVHARLDIDG